MGACLGLGVCAVGQPPCSAPHPLPFTAAVTSSPLGGISAPEGSHGRARAGGRWGQLCVVTAAVTLGGKSEWMGEWGQQSVGVGMAT